jgi:hypothetical protein
MARCPSCRKSFRCMEDEPPDECPYCGYTGRSSRHYCAGCGEECDCEERERNCQQCSECARIGEEEEE